VCNVCALVAGLCEQHSPLWAAGAGLEAIAPPAAGQQPEQGHSMLTVAGVQTAEALPAAGGASSSVTSAAVADAAAQLYVTGKEAVSPAEPCGSTTQGHLACQTSPSLSTALEAPEAQQGCHPASSEHGAGAAAGAAECPPCSGASEQQGLPGESPERLPGVLPQPQPTASGDTAVAADSHEAASQAAATTPQSGSAQQQHVLPAEVLCVTGGTADARGGPAATPPVSAAADLDLGEVCDAGIAADTQHCAEGVMSAPGSGHSTALSDAAVLSALQSGMAAAGYVGPLQELSTASESATTPAAAEADAAAHDGFVTPRWHTTAAGRSVLAAADELPRAQSAVSDAAVEEQHSSVVRESAKPEAMASDGTSSQLAVASGQCDAATSDAADKATANTISAVAGGSPTVLTDQLSNTAAAAVTRTALSQAGAGVPSDTCSTSPVATGVSKPTITAGFGLCLDAEPSTVAASCASSAPQGCSLSVAIRDPSEHLGTTPVSNGVAAVPVALAAADVATMQLSGQTAVQVQSTACASEGAAVKVLLAPQDSTSGQMEQATAAAAAAAAAAPAPAAGSTAAALAGASSQAVSHCSAAEDAALAVPSPGIGPAGSDSGAQDGQGAVLPEGAAGSAATGGCAAAAGPLAEAPVAAAGVSSISAFVGPATGVTEAETTGASSAAAEKPGESAGSASRPTQPSASAQNPNAAAVSTTAAGVLHYAQQENEAAQANQLTRTTVGLAATSQPSTIALDGTVAAGWQPCSSEGAGAEAALEPLEQSTAAAAAEQPCLPAAAAVLQQEVPAGESVTCSSEQILQTAPGVDSAAAPGSPHTATAAEAGLYYGSDATWAAAVALTAPARTAAQEYTPAAVDLGDGAAVDAEAATTGTAADEPAEPELPSPVHAAATSLSADDAAATIAAALVSLAADFEDGAAASAAMPKDSVTAQGTLCDVTVPGPSADAVNQPDSGVQPDGLLHVHTAGAAEEAAVDPDSEGRVVCSVMQQLLPLQLPCAVDGALAALDGGVVSSGAEVGAVSSTMQQHDSAASALSAAAGSPDGGAAQYRAEDVNTAGTSAGDAASASDVLHCSLGLGAAEATAVHPEEDSVQPPCAPAVAEHHFCSGIAAAPMAVAAPVAPAAVAAATAAVDSSAAAAAPEAAAESGQSSLSSAAQPAGHVSAAFSELHSTDAVEPGVAQQAASMPVIWARLTSDSLSAEELGLDTGGTSGEVGSCEQQADAAASLVPTGSVPAYSPVDDPAQCTSNAESTAAAAEAVGVTTASNTLPAHCLNDVSGAAAVLLPVTWPSGAGICPAAECGPELAGPTRTTAVAAPQVGESCSSANQGPGSEGSGAACSSPTSEHSRVSSSCQQAAEELCGVPVAALKPAAMDSCCSLTQPPMHTAGSSRSCPVGTQQGCTDASVHQEAGMLEQQAESAASSPATSEVPQGLRADSPEHRLPAASPGGTARHDEQVSAHLAPAADVAAVGAQALPANQADAAAIELELEWVIDALVADVSGGSTSLGSPVGSSTALDSPRSVRVRSSAGEL